MLMKNKYISIPFDESKLKKRNIELAFILEMSNFLSKYINLKELLQGALSKILKYFDLDSGRIYFIDEKMTFLNLAAYEGLEPGGLKKINIKEGFSGKSVETKAFIAQHVSELEDKKRVALLKGKGFKIIICTPLIVMGKVRGVMNLASKKDFILSYQKIDLLMAIGNQIAIVADNISLYEDLNCKIIDIKEKKEMIEFFAYSVSHDLKNPAIGIYGLTKRLYDKFSNVMDEKAELYCKQILKSAELIVSLLEKINTFIITKESSLDFEKINIKTIIKEVRNGFENLLKQRHIKWLEPDDLPEIIGDKLAFFRIFQNFTDNSLKYGGESLSKITIGYKKDQKNHIFSFSDNGIGIKPEAKEKIFGLFQRHDTSKGIIGSGLGLAIIKEAAERHNGNVWMDEHTIKGVTFYLSIPKKIKQQA